MSPIRIAHTHARVRAHTRRPGKLTAATSPVFAVAQRRSLWILRASLVLTHWCFAGQLGSVSSAI